MFEEDKKKVILAYQKKKEEGALSSNLANPTPGKLKDECLFVYQERYSIQDDETLRLFFGPKTKENNYGQIIKKIGVDKFKPLLSILKGEERKRPSDKNIKLLSWLINFEGESQESENTDAGINGPEVEYEKPEDTENVVTISDNETGDTVKIAPDEPESEIKGVKKLTLKPKVKTAVVSFMILVLATGGAYKIFSVAGQKCMYWTGDYYQSISCNETVGDTAIIALDTFKQAHLKRIIRPDTITKNSLGKVWYFKVNGDSIDCFTSAGFHPVYTERKLMPLTTRMLNKYILHKPY